MLSMSALSAEGEKVSEIYLRITLLDSRPAEIPVQVGVSAFENFRKFPWLTLAKFGIGRHSGRMDFPTGFDDNLPWENLGAEESFRIGEGSGWIPIGNILAVAEGESKRWPPVRKTLAFSFNSPQLPAVAGRAPRPDPVRQGAKPDRGNLHEVKVLLEFSESPSEAGIKHRIEYDSDISVIALDVGGTLDDKLKPQPLCRFTHIRPLRDTVGEQVEYLARELGTPAPAPRRMVSYTWVHHGYNFNFYDSATTKLQWEALNYLGVNYVSWYITPSPGLPVRDKRISQQCLELPILPKWVIPHPLSPFDRKKALAALREIVERWRNDCQIDPAFPVWCRVGDEIKLISEDSTVSHPEAAADFRAFAKQSGVPVSIPEAELHPVRKSDIRNAADAELYYLTCHYRQTLTLRWWQQYMGLLREVLPGSQIKFGMESCGISFNEWPDYYMMSRAGLMDFFVHEYTTKLWVPNHYAIALAAKHASAAKFGREESGGALAPSRGGTMENTELLGATALMRGFRNWYFYHFFDDTPEGRPLELAMPKLNRRIASLESFILDGKSSLAAPMIGVLWSRSTEIWRGEGWNRTISPIVAGGYLAERNLLMAALAFNQLPFDLLPEDEDSKMLARYKVLFATDPNLPRQTRIRLMEWVKNGGHLITVAGAGVRDEANCDTNFLHELTGDADAVQTIARRGVDYGEFEPKLYSMAPVGTVDFRTTKIEPAVAREELQIPGAEILAYWENGKAATIQKTVGKGCWTHVGFLPGTALARSASEAFLKSLKTRLGNEQHDQCEFSPALIAFYGELCPEAMEERSVTVSRKGVDAASFELPDRAAVLLADYTSSKEKTVSVELKFSRSFTKCQTEAGMQLQVKRLNKGALRVENIPLATSQVLFLE
jgi:hypothetical protein